MEEEDPFCDAWDTYVEDFEAANADAELAEVVDSNFEKTKLLEDALT